MKRWLLAEHQAARDAPLDGGRFVQREFHAGVASKEQDNSLVALAGRALCQFFLGGARSPLAHAGSFFFIGGTARRECRIIILVRGRLRAINFTLAGFRAITLRLAVQLKRLTTDKRMLR